MIDLVRYKSICDRNLGTPGSSVSRPLLTGGVGTERTIPVDVRIRPGRFDAPVEPRMMASRPSKSACRPVGMILDCYM